MSVVLFCAWTNVFQGFDGGFKYRLISICIGNISSGFEGPDTILTL